MIMKWRSSDAKGWQRHAGIRVSQPKLNLKVGRLRKSLRRWWRTKTGSVCELIASLPPKRLAATLHLERFCHFCMKRRTAALEAFLSGQHVSPLSLGWFNAAVQSSLTCSRMVASILHQQELLDSICILWLLPKTHLISRCRSVSERVIISTKLPCCSLWQVCNPPPRYSFVPAVSVPEIWSGLKLARCALVYGQIRRRGFYYQGESLLILHIKVPGGNSVTCGKCKSLTVNRSDLKRSHGIGKSVVKSKLCQPKSPGHITAGENQHSKLSTTLQ